VAALPSLLLTTFVALGPVLAASPPTAAVPAERPPEVAVPFGCGRVFPVSQAHSTGSHLQNDTWAWDFRMPEGTPIVAALDGVVRLARGDSSTGGCDPKFAADANYVVLEHPNGLETQYLHFASVTVKEGEQVRAGALLGFSGKTGWACGAHLHFKVARRRNDGWNNPSIPAVLAGYGDPQANTVIESPACLPQNPVLMAERPTVPPATGAEIKPASGLSAPVVEHAAALIADTQAQPPPVAAVEQAAGKTAKGGGGKVK
jgi:murein DD-endopeptidase MepM/ murein hydrolase activator NlpD